MELNRANLSYLFSGHRIGRLALKYDKLKEMDCLVATLSVDPVKSHTDWLNDVVAHCENEIEIKFPIIGDSDRSISTKYGMIDPGTSDEQSLPLTIREFICLCMITLLCAVASDDSL